jgi:hypothetical protein
LLKINYTNPPNDGGLQVVGDLGINFEGTGDMDITTDNATISSDNNNSISTLFTINLTTGRSY